FTTGKKGRTMCALEKTSTDGYRSDGLLIATINAWLTSQDTLAYNIFFQGSNTFGNMSRINPGIFCTQPVSDLLLYFIQTLVTLLLVLNQVGFCQGQGSYCPYLISQLCINCHRRPVPGRFPCLGSQLLDCTYGALHHFMTIQHSTQHDFLG